MTDHILNFFSSKNLRIIESQVFGDTGIEYWQSTVLECDGSPIGSGFSLHKEQARKIGVSEAIERLTCKELYRSSKTRSSWGLDAFPSACGFSAGFDLKNTVMRSLKEAAERWVMSRWIDDQYFIPEFSQASIIPTLDPISKYFCSNFDEVRFFSKSIVILVDGTFHKVTVAQTMALKGEGIFPGSSSQIGDGSFWQHALLESFRHLMGVKNNPSKPNSFPDNKVLFFSKNSKIALEQIKNATRVTWPIPKIKLHKTMSLYDGKCFIARTILDGWKSWTEGPLERFVY